MEVEKYLFGDAIREKEIEDERESFEQSVSEIESVPQQWLNALCETIEEFPELTIKYYEEKDLIDRTRREALHRVITIEPKRSALMTGVLFHVHFKESFNEVTPLLRFLRGKLNHVEQKGEPSDATHQVRRTWTYKSTLDNAKLPLKVMAFPYDEETSKCELIETGEKKPVKKIVCKDD